MNTAGTVILIIVLLLIAAAVGWVFFARYRAQRLGLPPPSWSSFIPFRSSESAYGVQPAPGGIRGWFNDRIRGIRSRNTRTAVGAYEGPGPSGTGAGRRGFGPLDPDDAWDTRVGTEAEAYYYNEEQELGLHPRSGGQGGGASAGAGAGAGGSRLDVSNTAYLGSGPLGGSTYDMNLAASTVGDDNNDSTERGRSRGRSPVTGTGPSGRGAAPGLNPFDDDAADPSNLSLRGVSPRPIVEQPHGSAATAAGESGGAAHDGDKDSAAERRSIFRENV